MRYILLAAAAIMVTAFLGFGAYAYLTQAGAVRGTFSPVAVKAAEATARYHAATLAIPGRNPAPPSVPALRQNTAGYCEDGGGEPEALAEIFIVPLLKSPASLKIVRADTRRSGECEFTVSGEYDASNAFGAIMRSKFIFALTFDPDKELWHSIRLDT